MPSPPERLLLRLPRPGIWLLDHFLSAGTHNNCIVSRRSSCWEREDAWTASVGGPILPRYGYVPLLLPARGFAEAGGGRCCHSERKGGLAVSVPLAAPHAGGRAAGRPALRA